ncbi:putative disease resistance protein RGA3 [Oryza brachyantha]|uniref:NB-ARC domain-containing protein n=1 Tax=Oryza brachyantha TaxID=4533 RepID=J3MI62_ORYBR|nr:putative disease resistance protein RGA3 [Oryza brachyantha]
MENIFCAIVSDLASRSISFLINKCSEKRHQPAAEKRLQRLLLRARIIVEEADERLITKHAMLQQLSILRKEMYRGYYTLDRFRRHGHEEGSTKDHKVSDDSFAASSSFNPAKRIRFCRVSGQSSEEQLLLQVLGCLGVTIEDSRELVMLLSSCPRLCHQPYSMHLLLDIALFNRQTEMEHIMSFLLKDDTPGAESPAVLPIVGPCKVGKSTLIEHACRHERVRNRFRQIVSFSEDDLQDASMVTLRDCGVIKHQNHETGGAERVLIVIELTRDIDESAWSRLYSASKSFVANGSKIIVASRSDKIARFGSNQTLRVKYFTQEAYWYLFKVRTFGSVDAEEHPELASIAMDVAMELNGCFMSASVWTALMKANFNAEFWSMALSSIREYKHTNFLVYGVHRDYPWQATEPAYVRRVNKNPSEYLVISYEYQTCSPARDAEVSELNMQEFLFGSVVRQGKKFKVVAWRSHLPPHYNYIFTCEVWSIQSSGHRAARKRSQKLCT